MTVFEVVREQVIGLAISEELAKDLIKDYRKAIPVDEFVLKIRKRK